MMMNIKSPFESVIEEFCSRYNLKPEQVAFEVKLNDVSKEIAPEIAKDYGNKNGEHSYFIGESCTLIDNHNFSLWVHYPKSERVEEDEELIIE